MEGAWSLVFCVWLCIHLCVSVETSAHLQPPELPELAVPNSTCPPWTQHRSPLRCECRVPHQLSGILLCTEEYNQTVVSVLFGFCVTLDKLQKELVAGECPYNIKRWEYHSPKEYFTLPSLSSELDSALCGYTRRTGQMCGHCEPGTSPPVYSYHPQCVNCTAGTNNWGQYLAVSLGPLTVFFLGTVAIRLRVTSTQWNGVIFAFQLISSPPVLQWYQRQYYAYQYTYLHGSSFILSSVVFTYFSMWNLDFFRTVYSPFCLHPSASTLQILSLDYIIAVYPLVLITLTYVLVTLHYNNCRLVVWLWKPFHVCYIHFRRQWNIRNSLVDAFATFLLLSYVKFLSTSINILSSTVLYYNTPKHDTRNVFYYDGTVEYFKGTHILYALLAIAVLLVFILFPILLLLLYPCLWFQRFLSQYHLNSQALYTFMDSFQGSFKDGTNGTRDYRYFAAVYLIARVVLYISLDLVNTYGKAIVIVMLMVMILLLSTLQPYKKHFFNKVDIFFLGALVILVSAKLNFGHILTHFGNIADHVIMCIVAPLPVGYSLVVLLSTIWKRSRVRLPVGRLINSLTCQQLLQILPCKWVRREGDYQLI